MSDPRLSEARRKSLLNSLMEARRDVKKYQGDPDQLKLARARVNEAKIALGERGPVWWEDGRPDENRVFVQNSSYKTWWRSLENET